MEFSIQSKRYPISKLRHERLMNLSLKIELFRPSTMAQFRVLHPMFNQFCKHTFW